MPILDHLQYKGDKSMRLLILILCLARIIISLIQFIVIHLFFKALLLYYFFCLKESQLQINLMSLIGKRILVVGGNGYLGNYFAARFVRQKATVMALSRSATKYEYPENKQITWLKGSILDPNPLKKEINSADIIIDTIGTLFDTSVTKNTPPGGPGTYEQMNRDTLISLLNVLQTPKTVIYISSGGHPPFLQRYLTTKYQAQQALFASFHKGYSLRPGFIYSWEHRKWSIPIKWQIDAWRLVYPLLQKIVPENSKLHSFLKQFKQAENVALQDLGDAVIQLALNGNSVKANECSHIRELSQRLKRQKKY